MAKKTTPSNDSVAKKLEAIKKKREQTASDKVDAKKKSISNKVAPKKVTKPTTRQTAKSANKKATSTTTRKSSTVRSRKSKVDVEKSAPKIDYDSYPITPVVAAWQNMVQASLDRYQASLPDKPSADQLRRIEIFEERIRRAPYDLRNSSFRNNGYIPSSPHLPQKANKKVTKRKAVRKKK